MKRLKTTDLRFSIQLVALSIFLLTFSYSVKTKAQTISLEEALDDTSLIWTTGGDTEWYGQTSIYYFDGDAAQSGDIENYTDENSWIQTTVTGPGEILFHWKVSQPSAVMNLKFEIDSIWNSNCSVYEEWEQKTYLIPPGSHILRWNY